LPSLGDLFKTDIFSLKKAEAISNYFSVTQEENWKLAVALSH